MFSIAAGSLNMRGDGKHGFHGNDHSGFEYGIDILPQFDGGFSPVVVGKDAEGVSVPEGSVREESPASVEFVEFCGNIAAAYAWFDEGESVSMDVAVFLPYVEMDIGSVFAKECAFEGGIIAEDHGEAVETKDVAWLHGSVGDGVMSPIGILS